MNAATLLNELHSRNVALLVVRPGRLRFEAKRGSLDNELLTSLREHKPAVLVILGNDGSMAKLLGRSCPFCRRVGMRIEETWKSELYYFDTRCSHCDQIVETLAMEATAQISLHEVT